MSFPSTSSPTQRLVEGGIGSRGVRNQWFPFESLSPQIFKKQYSYFGSCTFSSCQPSRHTLNLPRWIISNPVNMSSECEMSATPPNDSTADRRYTAQDPAQSAALNRSRFTCKERDGWLRGVSEPSVNGHERGTASHSMLQIFGQWPGNQR